MADVVGMTKKVLGGIVKAPGAVVGFAGATAAGAVGGVVKATGKGVVSGVKTAGKMKTKILGEAAEAAAKGGDDVVKAASPPDFNYRSRVQNGTEIFERQPKSGGEWENISNKEFADARHRNHTSGNEFSDINLPAVIAQENAESGAGFWNGIPGWAKSVGIGTAGIIAGGIIFDDDDE